MNYGKSYYSYYLRVVIAKRESNPKLAEEIKDILIGSCGFSEVCGKPGNMRAHPGLPTIRSWCDEHWNHRIKYRIFTPGDIVQYAFYSVIIGIFIYSIVSAWKIFSYG